jgi:hypothetical protein
VAEIRHTRFQQLLRQVFALTEGYAPSAIEDIMPVYSVEDPTEPHLYLSKEVFIVFGGTIAVPAAAEVAAVDIAPTQPSSRGVFDVLQLALSAGTAMSVVISHVGFGAASPTVVTPFTPLDGRRIGSETNPQRSNFGLSAQIAGFAAPTANAWQVTLTPNAGLVIPWKAALYRSALRIQGGLINTALRVGVYGQERIVEPAEERGRISAAP